MPQPRKQSWRTLRSRSTRAKDFDEFLNLLRSLDRTVVDMSMNIYNVPRRDRPAMLEQHRRLHDMVREQLSAMPLPRHSPGRR